MPRLTIIGHHSGVVPAGATVLDALISLGISLHAPCGGNGRCGQCRFKIRTGTMSEPTAIELQEQDRDSRFPRLACQARIVDDVAIELPPPATSSKETTGVVRAGPGPLGLAVDLGTTTIAAYLVDGSGSVLSTAAGPNPQRTRGADVITRLAYALADPAHPQVLAAEASSAINRLVRLATARSGADPDLIAEVVIAGNTAMQHLFVGWDVSSLARAPYVPASLSSSELSASQAGLDLNARVHVLPAIGGFVGGDHVALLLSLEPPTGPLLAIDVGTNTEISIWTDRQLVSCSCASGPAFEGGLITHGMSAQDGAIDHIRVEREQLRWSVLGGGTARGLCGSGLVDLARSLLELGQLAPSGRLEKTVCLGDITFSQTDVRQLQLAKAAIAAGIAAVLSHVGLTDGDIETVGIAGAFGAAVDYESGIDIGMFPRLGSARWRSLGNAAGRGAIMALDPEERERAARLAQEARHLDLVGVPGFQDSFVRHLELSSWTM